MTEDLLIIDGAGGLPRPPVPAVPYDQLDPNIVTMVREIHAFPGISTSDSCGGHADPKSCQLDARHWAVYFDIDRTDAAYLSLEFLAWLCHDYGRIFEKPNSALEMRVSSFPPYLNGPGTTLYFVIAGEDLDPDDTAEKIALVREERYITTEQLAAAHSEVVDDLDDAGTHGVLPALDAVEALARLNEAADRGDTVDYGQLREFLQ